MGLWSKLRRGVENERKEYYNNIINLIKQKSMKKINFYLGAFAVASTALLSSCFSSDGGDDTPKTPEVEIREDVVYTLVPSANVEGVTYSNTGNLKKGETITVTATVPAVDADKYTQSTITKTITVGENATINVPFTFILKPVAVDAEEKIGDSETLTVYQGKAEGTNASTTTTEVNEAAKDIEIVEDAKIDQVAMEIPKTAVAEAKDKVGSTEFSVVVVPANDDIQQIPLTEVKKVENKPAEVSTLEAVCEPTGATFTNPVTITISAPESAGLEFVAKNGDDEVKGEADANTLTIKVPHFSVWNYVLKANVTNVSKKHTYVTRTARVVAGDNPINYTSTLGWSVNKKNVLVNAYLVGLLGSSRTVNLNKTAQFVSTGNGVVTYRVYSNTVEFDVVSGLATFHVAANTGSTLEIVNVEYDGHSGGNAQ